LEPEVKIKIPVVIEYPCRQRFVRVAENIAQLGNRRADSGKAAAVRGLTAAKALLIRNSLARFRF
jgi:hypothetical protein